MSQAYWAKFLRTLICVQMACSLGAQPISSLLWQGRYDREVFLLGNIADIESMDEYARSLVRYLQPFEQEVVLVFTGDLLPQHENFLKGSVILDKFLRKLIEVPELTILLLPGDRDWDDGSRQGLTKLRLLEQFLVNQDYGERILFQPSDGCPGPLLYDIAPELNILVLNTQWWNQKYGRPTTESAICNTAEPAAVIEEIESLIDESATGNLLIVGHHPIFSHGPFGGYFPVSQWLLPIPPFSILNRSFLQNVGSDRYSANPRLAQFEEDLSEVLAPHFSIIYASGHEKNLEAFRIGENVVINSGAPEKGGFVRKVNSTLVHSRRAGFISLHYHSSGHIGINHHEWLDTGITLRKTVTAYQAPCLAPMLDIPVNRRLIPCLEYAEESPEASLDHPDEITIAANPYYIATKGQKRWLGKHYRDSWTTKVKVPVLDLNVHNGGLQPFEEGGGRQTSSLKFRAGDGLEYVFRSVDKDPSKALRYDLRSTIISLLVRDQTTTQQPYGALVVGPMLDQLNILHATPRLFVMPNAEELGPFKSKFGGMLGMLEDRPVDPQNGESFADADDVKRTMSLFRKMFQSPAVRIETSEFIRARIFDMLVGDWGKHEDNWKWAGFEDEIGMLYRPIPRDRDHVFSLYDGLLPSLIDREWAKPSGEHFGYRIKGLRSLMWQARHLDRFVAAEADLETWMAQTKRIQSALNPQIIQESIHKLPTELHQTAGEEIAAKLEQRLHDLQEYTNAYYKMLARTVDVIGSHSDERVFIDRLADGRVQVGMYAHHDSLRVEPQYARVFKPTETKEIRFFGLNGDDHFHISGSAKKSIKIRIVPGKGRDMIADSSWVKGSKKQTLIYEDLGSVDNIKGSGEIKFIRNAPEEAYHYQRTAFHYDTYFPLMYLTFSSDYGISLNSGVSFTNHSYGRPDFSSKHGLSARLSSVGNFKFSYDGTWRHRVGTLDLIGGLEIESRRRYRHFFGLGNETKIDQELRVDDYYTSQFASGNAYFGLEKTFFSRSYLNLSTSYQLVGGNALENNILSAPENQNIIGVNRVGILAFQGEFDLDFRNRKDLPERGARIYIKNKFANSTEDEYGSYLTGQASIEYFITAAPFTLGIRGGSLYSTGDAPYYDVPALGQNAHLRGYRRNRFSGESAVFLNSQLRIELLNKTTSFIPYKLGIKSFVDLGRVYLKGEESTKLHLGYGGGLYFVPLQERFTLSLSFAFSEEEKGLVLFGLGRSF